MASMDIFNITVGIIGIIAFVFSVWVWMRSDIKIRELLGVICTIDEIVGTAILEWESVIAGDYELKLRQAEKTQGFVSSIKKLTAQFVPQRIRISGESAIGRLIERNVLWTKAMVWDIEASKETTEIWLVTPDLKPDVSDETVGKLVQKNIRSYGKRYVYFYPDDLPHAESETARLLKNIGLTDSDAKRLRDKVTLVPLSKSKHGQLFVGGNIILYYRDEHRILMPRCFEEVVLTKFPERGAFWQEHAESKTNELRHLLAAELQKFIGSSAKTSPQPERSAT